MNVCNMIPIWEQLIQSETTSFCQLSIFFFLFLAVFFYLECVIILIGRKMEKNENNVKEEMMINRATCH